MVFAMHAPPCLAQTALARPVPARWGCNRLAPCPLEQCRSSPAARQPGFRLAAAAVDMESLEKAAVDEPELEDMVVYAPVDKPRIKKRSRRFR